MKKIISMITILTLLLSMGLTFAEEQPSGDGNVDIKGPTIEEISIDQSRMMKTKTQIMGIGTDSLGESYFRNLFVPCFEQENSYYCGPATVKQTLHYINGISLSQKDYADILGTDQLGYSVLGDMKDLINDKQSKRNYILATVTSRAQFEGKVENALRANVPVVLHIKGDKNLGWKYTNGGGHFLNGSGLSYTYYTLTNFTSNTKVTDPWKLGIGDTWYSTETVYNVVDNRLNYILY